MIFIHRLYKPNTSGESEKVRYQQYTRALFLCVLSRVFFLNCIADLRAAWHPNDKDDKPSARNSRTQPPRRISTLVIGFADCQFEARTRIAISYRPLFSFASHAANGATNGSSARRVGGRCPRTSARECGRPPRHQRLRICARIKSRVGEPSRGISHFFPRLARAR